ncbi:WD40 repeat-like protein [Jaminaea rosea]|uniref:WD40 repeat-like protein n=1 Tax=Jaminaea rosea TaxID=1569628 RepID=A0A316UTE7_9BASI|nr:WD40 repeat-like protein [Jaminaea rosea]PWN28274.1 WD40 repeat-like protein [Jaminaea rosea]
MASYLLSLSPFKVFATEAGDSASASASTSTSTSTSSTSTGLPPLTSSPRPATPRSRSGRRSMKRDRPSPVPASFFGDVPQSSVATSSSPIRASKRKGKGRMLTEDQEEEAGGSGRLSSDAHSDEGVELLPDGEDGVVRLDLLRRLPHEISLLILLYLPTHQSLVSLSAVSRYHRSLANDPLLWRELFFRNPGWTLREDEEWVEGLLDDLEGREGVLLPEEKGVGDESTYDMTDLQIGDPDSSSSRILPSSWSLRVHGNRQRNIDRLNWRYIYSLRFYLASRVGQVHSRWGCVKDKQVKHPSWDEDFSDDDRSISSNEESQDEGDDDADSNAISENSEDETDEASYRRRVESESRAATLQARLFPSSTSKRTRHNAQHHSRRNRTFAPDLRTIGSHEDNIYCIKSFLPPKHFAPTVGYIVTGSRDATIRVWSLSSPPSTSTSSSTISNGQEALLSTIAPRIGRCTHILRGGHTRSIVALDVCPKGMIMVSASSDSKLGIWNWFGCDEAVQAAREGRQWKPRLIDRWNCYTTVMDVRLSEEWLCFGLRQGMVRCYRRLDLLGGNAQASKRAEEEEEEDTSVTSAFSPLDVVPPTSDAAASTSTENHTPPGPPTLFERASVHQHYNCSINDLKIRGRLLACGYANGHLEVVDIPTGRVLYPPDEGQGERKRIPQLRGVACMEFGMPGPALKVGGAVEPISEEVLKGSVIICGSTDLSIYCYSPYSGDLLAVLEGHQAMPRSLHLDEEKGLLISVGYDGIVNMWDVGRLFWVEERRGQHALGWNARGDWAELTRARTTSVSESQQGDSSAETSQPVATTGPSAVYKPKPIYTSRDFNFHTSSRSNTNRAGTNAGAAGAVNAQGITAGQAQQTNGGAAGATGGGGGNVATATTWRASTGGTPRVPCRLFGVAFDGKRILTVGETRHIFVRELLPPAAAAKRAQEGVEEEKQGNESEEEEGGSEGEREGERGLGGYVRPEERGREWVGWEMFA